MTATLDTPTLTRAVGNAASLLSSRLPFAFDPLPVDDRAGVLSAPGEGSLALSAGITGIEGSTVLLALTAASIAALVDGPLGHQEPADALGPVLADALAALEPVLGSGLSLDAPQVLPADLALESVATTGGCVAGVVLQTESGPGGMLVVRLPASDLALEPLTPGAEPADGSGQAGSLELLGDVEMAVTAVLGRTRLSVRHLLGIAIGHVVELDRTADSAVDLLVNGTLVARGEVVVIDDEFGVRITEIVGRRGRD
jgi:flagellar motor switch protein FliN/FliY